MWESVISSYVRGEKGLFLLIYQTWHDWIHVLAVHHCLLTHGLFGCHSSMMLPLNHSTIEIHTMKVNISCIFSYFLKNILLVYIKTWITTVRETCIKLPMLNLKGKTVHKDGLLWVTEEIIWDYPASSGEKKKNFLMDVLEDLWIAYKNQTTYQIKIPNMWM